MEPISMNNRGITLTSLKVTVTYNLGVRNNLFVCFKADKSSYFNQSIRHNRQLCISSHHNGSSPWFHGKLSHRLGEISVRYR